MSKRFDLGEVLAAYMTAALWSTNDESTPSGGVPLDENYTVEDIGSYTVDMMRKDCERFYRENEATILSAFRKDPELDWSQVGHDLWLNRNGHGCGFWDGDWPEPEASKLSAAAKKFGERSLIVTDEGKIEQL